MATQPASRTAADATPAKGGKAEGSNPSQRQQEITEQQQDQALEEHRGQPSPGEEQTRREQGGHDRPVGGDHRPHPRPKPDADAKR